VLEDAENKSWRCRKIEFSC